MSERHVIVVGGGVIGTACAHHLSLTGWKVTLLERDRVGAACSHGNCGLICPSHVLPLTTPGAIKSALQALLSSNGPFRIKPRFDPTLWAWLYHFARRCNQRDMLSAARAIQALLNSSRSLYAELLRDVALDAEYENRGTLFVFQSRAGLDHYAETNHLLSAEFALPATRYDGAALVALEPALKPGAAAGAWHYPGDAHVRPDRLLSTWRRILEKRGVTILEGCDVTGFERERQRAVAVTTARGTVTADAFVVAAGALTPRLSRFLGCKIPIQPGKGYSITMPRPASCPTIPLLFEEHRVVATPMRSGYRLGSTMEFAGYDTTLNRRRLDLLREGARPYLHEPYCDPVEETWYGWRPMTYDSLPIIGAAPALRNVVIAAGHNMLGLSMAPATGKLVAEMLNGVKPHVDPSPFAPTRF